jgi:ribonuclease-3
LDGNSTNDNGTETDISRLEEILGCRFRQKCLLQQALTHKSFAHEASEGAAAHNELMEFLGDSILGFLVTDIIYHGFPGVTEGRLSKIKAYLVSATALVVLAQEIGLPDYLRLGKGEEKTGGRKKKALIANAFEAVIAAIYLDHGVEDVRRFLSPLYAPLIQEIRDGHAVVEDPKTTLQEYIQARNLPLARYVVTNESGPQHRKTFHVEVLVDEKKLAKASGTTKKRAESQAAQAALRKLWRLESK